MTACPPLFPTALEVDSSSCPWYKQQHSQMEFFLGKSGFYGADGAPVDQTSVDSDQEHKISNAQPRNQGVSKRGIAISDAKLIEDLDRYSIEDVVELKISRFLDQIGTFFPENMHELIMSKVEKPLLVQILRRVGGNQVQAAKILGINRNTLRKKIKLYGI